MMRPSRRALWIPIAVAALSCSRGERATGKDTTSIEPSPAGRNVGRRSPGWIWDTTAGPAFAIRGESVDRAILVSPSYTSDDQLDSLSTDQWPGRGIAFEFMAGGRSANGVISDAGTDSSCAGWPVGSVSGVDSVIPDWRVAFPSGRMSGIPFDSLPAVAAKDSVSLVTAVALAASRLPDDTSAAFRGRPYVVRQANRFSAGDTGRVMLVEVVRLVPQEANPMQEQLLMILQSGTDPRTPPVTVFHARQIGLEESLASIELLGVFQLRGTGRLALLLRRDRESGFLLQWIERTASGRWTLRWQSAVDAC